MISNNRLEASFINEIKRNTKTWVTEKQKKLKSFHKV